jgi:hypothetical protein
LKRRLSTDAVMALARFDSTYEGLKRRRAQAGGANRTGFGSTYEGLKPLA